MFNFDVPEMSCSHCKAAIEMSVQAIDPSAKIVVDLSSRTVEVDSASPKHEVISAIGEAGFQVSSLATN